MLYTIKDEQSSYSPHKQKKIKFVQDFLKSGLAQKEFCDLHHLKPSTFKNWLSRYKSGDAGSNSNAMPVFSSVILRDEAPPLKEKVVKDLQIKRKDFIVTVPVGFDLQTLFIFCK